MGKLAIEIAVNGQQYSYLRSYGRTVVARNLGGLRTKISQGRKGYSRTTVARN